VKKKEGKGSDQKTPLPVPSCAARDILSKEEGGGWGSPVRESFPIGRRVSSGEREKGGIEQKTRVPRNKKEPIKVGKKISGLNPRLVSRRENKEDRRDY